MRQVRYPYAGQNTADPNAVATYSAPYGTSAAGAAQTAHKHRARLRAIDTPEGVSLNLEIASAGARLGALLIDFVLQGLIGVGLLLALSSLEIGSDQTRKVIFGLCMFLLINFWFMIFELGPRAATPGKRIVGIRVVARDGGQLTVPAVAARNFVRPLEIGLPLTFLMPGLGGDAASAGTVLFGIMWTLGLGFFLLFNKDRMRLGDLIAGTWVVLAPKHRLSQDLAMAPSATPAGEPVFTPAELAVYGVFELQELERVLRDSDNNTVIVVADTIRHKLGRTLQEDDRVFLTAFYRQLKAKQERDLLFGRRRENKYEV